MPTPTPWLDTGMFVESAEGGVIASVNDGEDRRFIVRVCNAHGDLVSALQHARRNLIIALRVNVNLGDDFDPEEHVTIKEIDAALAKAA